MGTRGTPTGTPAPIVVDDLRDPRLPRWFRAAERVARVAERRVRLDPDDLLAAARRRTGLSDLGGDGVIEDLSCLSLSLDAEAGLNAVGRIMVRQLLVGLLETRLRMTDLLERHPEVLDQTIEAPIVILGLPRTGTTHLHGCLAADPALAALPYYESLEPVPADPPLPGRPDPRIARTAKALDFLTSVMPLLPAMHEMTAEGPHEEIQLLAVAFSTMLFEASYEVPTYRERYRGTEHTPAYVTLRRLLQILQWEHGPRPGGPRRWVLKSPQHLEELEPLLAVFPDACLVQTHRDPVSVSASMGTMAAYLRRMQHREVDPIAIGRYWADRIEVMLRASVADRARVAGADRTLDVRFADFMADEDATIGDVYRSASQPLDRAALEAIAGYRRSNPRGRHGRLAYRLGDLGLDRDELRARFAWYCDRFDVPEENP